MSNAGDRLVAVLEQWKIAGSSIRTADVVATIEWFIREIAKDPLPKRNDSVDRKVDSGVGMMSNAAAPVLDQTLVGKL